MNLTARSVPAFAIAFALALGGIPVSASAAYADELDDAAAKAQQAVDEASASLESAESRMDSLASEYDELRQQADELQARVDEAASKVLEAQQAVIEGRNALGLAAASEYRSGGSAQSLATLLFESSSFNELLRNITYLGKVVDYQADEVAAQQERTAQFEKLVDDLNFQKSEQDAKLTELEAKKAEAERLVAEASSALQGAQDDRASRLAALQQRAEALAAQAAAQAQAEVDNANTVERQPVVPDGSQVAPNPAPAPAPAPTPTPTPTPDPGASWSTGVASAYGGSTDPYTPNPGITATGAVCDDWSMGVAIPTAWPNYRQYFGRTVEISYGGMTVYATVNDCGGMGGGSRSLDLQPGVWKAFGFSSCRDWGLRTVSYRFL